MGARAVAMNCHPRNLREIAMASNNAENRDAAIQRLVDQMRIPYENRSAAASRLLQCIRLWEKLNQYGRYPISRNLIVELPSHASKLRGRPRGFTDTLLFGVMTGLYTVQKKHGGKLLTLTKNLKSREASGSLPAALKIVHGLIPSLVAARSPYSTLYRMRRVILGRSTFGALRAQNASASPRRSQEFKSRK